MLGISLLAFKPC